MGCGPQPRGGGGTTLTEDQLAAIDKAATLDTVVALVDSATITPDFSAGRNFSVTLGGNRTIANPTNMVTGQTGYIAITQDGTGGRQANFGTYWHFPSSPIFPPVGTQPGTVVVLRYNVVSATSVFAVYEGSPAAAQQLPLDGLVLWLDPDYRITLADPQLITTWEAKVPEGFFLYSAAGQTSGMRYKASYLNGHAVLDPNAYVSAYCHLATANNNITSGDNPFTLSLFGKSLTGAGLNNPPLFQLGSAGYVNLYVITTGNKIGVTIYQPGNDVYDTGLTLATNAVITLWYDGTGWGVRQNGVNGTGLTPREISPATDLIRLGMYNSTPAGYYGDILMWNRLLGASEITQTESFLASKYGVTLT